MERNGRLSAHGGVAPAGGHRATAAGSGYGPVGTALAPSPAGCARAGGTPAAAEPAPTPRCPTALLGTRPGATQAGLSSELLRRRPGPLNPGPSVPYATRAPRCLGSSGGSLGLSLACKEPGPPQGCPAQSACHSHLLGPPTQAKGPGLAGGDPHAPSESPQLPLLLFVLHGEPSTLTKQETAPSDGGHGHGHTPGPAGPGAHVQPQARLLCTELPQRLGLGSARHRAQQEPPPGPGAAITKAMATLVCPGRVLGPPRPPAPGTGSGEPTRALAVPTEPPALARQPAALRADPRAAGAQKCGKQAPGPTSPHLPSRAAAAPKGSKAASTWGHRTRDGGGPVPPKWNCLRAT